MKIEKTLCDWCNNEVDTTDNIHLLFSIDLCRECRKLAIEKLSPLKNNKKLKNLYSQSD